MAALGYVLSPWAIVCLPAAMTVSFAFAAVGMAGTTFMRSWQDFDKVSLALIPLFLFSATFYPLWVYPGWLQAVIRCTPLYQGVALLRGLDTGILSWSMVGHAAYLLAAGCLGLVVATRRMAALLLP
jgi:lipooligosaccharide transport system permease protein